MHGSPSQDCVCLAFPSLHVPSSSSTRFLQNRVSWQYRCVSCTPFLPHFTFSPWIVPLAEHSLHPAQSLQAYSWCRKQIISVQDIIVHLKLFLIRVHSLKYILAYYEVPTWTRTVGALLAYSVIIIIKMIIFRAISASILSKYAFSRSLCNTLIARSTTSRPSVPLSPYIVLW